LGVARFFQETQCSDFLSKELLHQYFAIADVRLLQTFLVSRKTVMQKVGMD
jgi:hypothetical protein